MAEVVQLIAAYGLIAMIGLLALCGIGVSIIAAITLWVKLGDEWEKRQRGTIPTPMGALHPPTNRELRRARKEYSSADEAENIQKG
jgi:hypothetical protein